MKLKNLIKNSEVIKLEKCSNCGKEINLAHWKGEDFLLCSECLDKSKSETLYSRKLLTSIISKIKLENIYYLDTDLLLVNKIGKKLVEKPNQNRLELLKQCKGCRLFYSCLSFPNGKCIQKK